MSLYKRCPFKLTLVPDLESMGNPYTYCINRDVVGGVSIILLLNLCIIRLVRGQFRNNYDLNFVDE